MVKPVTVPPNMTLHKTHSSTYDWCTLAKDAVLGPIIPLDLTSNVLDTKGTKEQAQGS